MHGRASACHRNPGFDSPSQDSPYPGGGQFRSSVMSQHSPQSPWRTRLVREIGIILLIKLFILLTIKTVWFTEPTVPDEQDRKSTRLNSSHVKISYAVFCLKKKKINKDR